MNRRMGMEAMMGVGGGTVSRQAAKALEKAEDLLRRRKPEQALPHIFKALEDPQCIDAAIQMASVMPTHDMAVTVLENAAKQGQKNLMHIFGPTAFDDDGQYVGRFWALLETRPYMRVLQAIVKFAFEAGHYGKSADTIIEILRLCPGDNLGQREWLGSVLLKAGRIADALSFSQVWTDAKYDSGKPPPRGGCEFAPPTRTPITTARYERLRDYGHAEQHYTAAYAAFKLWGDCELAQQHLHIAAKLNPTVAMRILARVDQPTSLNNQPRSINGSESAHDYLWLAQDLWMEPTVWAWINGDAEVLACILKTCSRPGCTNRETRAAEYKRCSACKGVSYCGPACQKEHWKTHKPICNEYKRRQEMLRALMSGRVPGQPSQPGDPLVARADFSANGGTTTFL